MYSFSNHVNDIVKIIVVSLLVFLALQIIYHLIHSSNVSSNDDNSESNNISTTNSEVEYEASNETIEQEVTPYLPLPEISQFPIESESTTSAIKSLQEMMNSPQTQQIYRKYEEVILPSSVDASTGGYIGRDYICYKEKIGNQSFVSKNPKCMVCSIDNSNNTQHSNTHTNITSTCVYSDDKNNTNPTVWTKQMCLKKCENVKDKN